MSKSKDDKIAGQILTGGEAIVGQTLKDLLDLANWTQHEVVTDVHGNILSAKLVREGKPVTIIGRKR